MLKTLNGYKESNKKESNKNLCISKLVMSPSMFLLSRINTVIFNVFLSILKLVLESVHGRRYKKITVFSSYNYFSGGHIQVTQQYVYMYTYTHTHSYTTTPKILIQ